MEQSSELQPKRHSRHGSSNRALPRRSTRGPLDLSEAPIPVMPTATSNASNLVPSPTASTYATPRLPSPQPGSNLSTLTYRTAHSTLSPSPSPSRASSTLTQPVKDFTPLLNPSICHPMSHLDIPPPFRTTNSTPSLNSSLPTLLSLGQFRAAAIKAASILTTSPPNSLTPQEIFNLIYIRLSSLTLCGQTALAGQEVKSLEDLNSSVYRDAEGKHLCPWELRVLAVRLQGMGFSDARRGVMGYYDLVREARLQLTSLKRARKSAVAAEGEEKEGVGRNSATIYDDEIHLWEERLQDLSIRVASALIEMEDLEGATRFLSSLSPSPPPSSPAGTAHQTQIQTQKALLYLCLGDVASARSCACDREIEALACMADADFAGAVTIWKELIAGTTAGDKEAMWKQNLAVCLLYLGRMDETREILEGLVSTGSSFHALTFNLCTVYELCTERSRALKIGLVEKIAGMLAEERKSAGEGDGEGDGVEGLRVVGWEKVNGDFKL